jgi:ankyrin repeat protein
MSVTIEVLGKDELQKGIAGLQPWLNQQREKLEPLDQLRELFRAGTSRLYQKGHSERDSFMVLCLNLARMLYATGKPTSEFRGCLQEGVSAFVPVVALFDYTPFEQSIAVPASKAKQYEGREITHDLGEVFLAPSPTLGPGYKTVRVKVRNQPAQLDMEKVLKAALMAWDFEGARKMAADYQLQPASKGDRVNRFGLLREAILGHQEGALAFLENVTGHYDRDFPPERRELAEGVIRDDARLVRAGLKAISRRFETAWTLKTYCTPAKLRRAGSMENMLPAIRSYLTGHHWLLSEWGIAWMSLAWHRGLKEAFAEPELFCEWLPWELCCPEPIPATTKPARSKPKRSADKMMLREKLFAAAAAGDVKTIAELASQGVKLDSFNPDRLTPLLLAARANHVLAVVALIKAKADVTRLDPKGRSILGVAADNGMRELVAAILSCGVKPDLTDKPVTALVRASRRGDVEIMQLLLKAGADPNRISAYGNSSSLTDAASAGHLKAVHLLIEAGADVSQPAGNGQCALHHAANRSDLEMLHLLLGAGANVNAQDYWGWTPLHLAAEKGFPDVVRALIAAGAALDVQNKIGRPAGMTPLMDAVAHPECLKLLLEAGADVSLRNKKRQTVFDLAQERPASLVLLKKYSGQT